MYARVEGFGLNWWPVFGSNLTTPESKKVASLIIAHRNHYNGLKYRPDTCTYAKTRSKKKNSPFSPCILSAAASAGAYPFPFSVTI